MELRIRAVAPALCLASALLGIPGCATLNSVARAVVLLALSLSGGACTPTKSPTSFQRDGARAAVLLVARGVVVADELCAEVVVRQMRDAVHGRQCKDAYDAARAALLAAEYVIDAWDAGRAGEVACAARRAAAALDDMRGAANAAGATMPAVVDDAVSIGGELGGGCRP